MVPAETAERHLDPAIPRRLKLPGSLAHGQVDKACFVRPLQEGTTKQPVQGAGSRRQRAAPSK